MKRDVKRKVPAAELSIRMSRFRESMDASNPEWSMAVIFNRINQYYFTGTMQDGLLVIPRDDKAVYHVRRSIERASDESLFPDIIPMEGFRDAAAYYSRLPETVYIEMEWVPLALYQRLIKHFNFKEVKPLDLQISAVRSVKSGYEIELMKESGRIHQVVMEEHVPGMLREGMSESDLAVELYAHMVREGHHGVTRFGMVGTETTFGTIGFGETSLYPTFFDGPGGNIGISPAVPMNGSPDVRLKMGQLVFLDVGCGVDGYHTDKTMTYAFGGSLPAEAVDAQGRCEDIMLRAAEMLKPGQIPSDIYKSIIKGLDITFLDNFMGFGDKCVKFLGHGIGLHTDERPVIAEGFNESLKAGMVIALEPKKGIAGVGMLGIENTFLVTEKGGISITGNRPGLLNIL